GAVAGQSGRGGGGRRLPPAPALLGALGHCRPAPGWSEEPDGASVWSSVAAETRFGGSLRGAYWSSSRSLDNREHLATSALWLEAGSRLAPGAWLHLDGWVGNEDLFHADATN